MPNRSTAVSLIAQATYLVACVCFRAATIEASVSRPPERVRDAKGCFFYHTLDLPGVGVVEGQWDLRRRFDDDVGGKLLLASLNSQR